jgi:hypothetical protein
MKQQARMSNIARQSAHMMPNLKLTNYAGCLPGPCVRIQSRSPVVEAVGSVMLILMVATFLFAKQVTPFLSPRIVSLKQSRVHEKAGFHWRLTPAYQLSHLQRVRVLRRAAPSRDFV